jgi:hypothetical protein
MHDHAGAKPAASPTHEIDRRTALKRGIAFGTASLWAVPTVQALGVSRANAQVPSPGPTTTTPTSTTVPTCPPIHNIQLIVRFHNKLYGLKYDQNWKAWSAQAPDHDDCIRFYVDSASVRADPVVAYLFNLGAHVTVIDECRWQVKRPADCFYVAGWAKTGDASAANCVPAQTSGDLIIFSTS